MGYRLPDRRENIRDVSTRSTIAVDNGTISYISIPCYYHGIVECPPFHDRMMHDHVGWPSPDNPDRSCQMPPITPHGRHIVLEEIDLPGEGYESVEVSMFERPAGLHVDGYILYNEVRLVVTAMCQAAENVDLDVPFSAYAIGTSTEVDDPAELRDVITKGTIHIVAGPINDDGREPDATITTEKIVDNAVTWDKLSNDVQSKIPVIAHGIKYQNDPIPPGQFISFSIDFAADVVFTNRPDVIVSLYSTSNSPEIGSMSVAAYDVSTSGFSVKIFNDGASTRTPGFMWIAVGT